jgi:hypothetical protein
MESFFRTSKTNDDLKTAFGKCLHADWPLYSVEHNGNKRIINTYWHRTSSVKKWAMKILVYGLVELELIRYKPLPIYFRGPNPQSTQSWRKRKDEILALTVSNQSAHHVKRPLYRMCGPSPVVIAIRNYLQGDEHFLRSHKFYKW